MRLTVLANGKGGCGKTTLATTLSSALAVAGSRVALADTDPQRSSITWLARRPMDAAPIGALDWSTATPEYIDTMLLRMEASLDWLIVDAPADFSHNPETRARLAPVIRRADNVVAPATPSFFDQHATRRFLADLEAEAERSPASVLLVANRAPRKRKHNPGQAPAQAPVATLPERRAYGKLAALGLGPFDSPRPRHKRIHKEWTPLLAALSAPLARSMPVGDA